MTRRLPTILVFTFLFAIPSWSSSDLHLTDHQTLETHGLTVLLFHNSYHHVFGDQKMSGMEIILHDQRIATNGDVRLSATPAQWDPIPDFRSRDRGPAPDEITASCGYPDRGLEYHIELKPEPGGFRVAVQLDTPLPAALNGKAGFNLEFLPSLYFGKSYVVDNTPGIFPRHDAGPMEKSATGTLESLPIATGSRIVLSPEDPLTRVSIASDSDISIYDGRNQAPNGWFVARSLRLTKRATSSGTSNPTSSTDGLALPSSPTTRSATLPNATKSRSSNSTHSSTRPKPGACCRSLPKATSAKFSQAKSNRGASGCAINMRRLISHR